MESKHIKKVKNSKIHKFSDNKSVHETNNNSSDTISIDNTKNNNNNFQNNQNEIIEKSDLKRKIDNITQVTDENLNNKSLCKKSKDKSDNNATEEIKSANAWEQVDLGSEDRKVKFLKLMGAGNTKPHGKFHIGQLNIERHTQAGSNLDNLDDTMQKQFEYGIDQKLSRGHQGIGSKEPLPNGSIDNSLRNKYKIDFVKSNSSDD